MGRKGKGRAVKRNPAAGGAAIEEENVSRAPHSFVIHRGKVGKWVQELTRDFRKVMEPFTATNIKVRPKNVIKDFVHIAGPLHVSHMAVFTRTERGPYVKIARLPRGPTLTLRITNYALTRDVLSSLRRQVTHDKQFLNHALLIMNNFKEEHGREVGLAASMFQNMFPSVNVTKVKLNSVRRCVLLSYDAERKSIEFRHYALKVVPVGMCKAVKKIVQGKVPNLSRYEDMSEFIERSGNLSESEFEDDEASKVILPQRLASRGNLNSQQSSVRLIELGPRITMDLIKIEEGLFDGEVLYHRLVEKTEKEKKAIRALREKRKKEKERRQREQQLNVKKKEEAREELKRKSMAGIDRKKQEQPQAQSQQTKADDDEDSEYEYEAEEPEEKRPRHDFKRRENGSGDFKGKRPSFQGNSVRGRPGSGRGSRGSFSGGSGRGSRGSSPGGFGRGSRGSFSGGSGRGSRGSSFGGSGRGSRGSSFGGSGRGSRGSSFGGSGRGSRGSSSRGSGRGSRGSSSRGSSSGGRKSFGGGKSFRGGKR